MASVPTHDEPRPRGPARREALLQAVLAIVAEVGADAVTHRRVAERARLPLASTTYWFDSKEHLLTAALQLAAERDLARLKAHCAAVAAGDVEPLKAAVDAIVDPGDAETNRGSHIAAFALLLEAARRPELREISRRWTDAYLAALRGLLSCAGSHRPDEDAELLLGAADGLLISGLAVGDETDVRPRLLRLATALVSTP